MSITAIKQHLFGHQDEATAKGGSHDRPLLAAITFSAPLVPSIAAALTVVFFVMGRSGPQALVYGAAAALLIWMGMAWLSRQLVNADGANPGIYNQLRERLDSLKVQLVELKDNGKDKAAYNEACVHYEFVADRLGVRANHQQPGAGMQRATPTGIWNRIHRAEEALIELAPREAAVGRALYDEGRLRGSTIPERDDLLLKIVTVRGALEQLGKTSAQTTQMPNSNVPLSMPEALAQLRTISHVINKFRGDRWEGVARAYNQLNQTGLFTGIVAYALLSIMLVMATEPPGVTIKHIIAATLFYLVGAISGLFSRLMADANSPTAIEDYGLSFARLIHTPLFSGLAAIGGVVLVAMLPTPISGQAQGLSLPFIFDLGQNPFGLVTAAVFGLTPRLLIDRLQGQAEQYKLDLKKSEASENG